MSGLVIETWLLGWNTVHRALTSAATALLVRFFNENAWRGKITHGAFGCAATINRTRHSLSA